VYKATEVIVWPFTVQRGQIQCNGVAKRPDRWTRGGDCACKYAMPRAVSRENDSLVGVLSSF
jgi:hypothetical protein